MKNNIWSVMLFISLCTYTHAQNSVLKIKVVSETNEEPLIGASVYIQDINTGSITDLNGLATIDNIPKGSYTIKISFLGYTSLERNLEIPYKEVLIAYLKENGEALEEVFLESNRSTRTIKRIPTRVEVIGGEELSEKNAMNATNISMVLRESTGIQMQQTSLSSANSSIRIQGLDGRYTQLLRDGFPLYGGFSSGLSILQIPPLDLKQFEIIKGSSSTLYGGGAIAGLVNLISKTPEEEPELDIMLTQTHALGTTGNIFYSKRTNKFGVTLYGSGYIQKEFDPENDGFSNLPRTKSISVNPKLFYYPSDKTKIWFGINGTYDDRIGGDINGIKNRNDNLYTEENVSKRISTQAVYTTEIDTVKSINIKNSFAYFDRDLTVPNINFNGTQINSFTEVAYKNDGKRSDWIFGANLYTIDFDEESSSLERDQSELTAGLFVNNIYDFSENWILETGFRGDYVNDWGFFPLPKLSLLYKANNSFSSRIGGGLGYKIPDIFTEEAELINFNNILAIDSDTLEAERSYGVNLDFNFETYLTDEIDFSINQLFYVTAIQDGLLLRDTGTGFFEFENAGDNIVSKGAETNIKFSYRDFRWFLNYAFIDTRLNYLDGNPQKPLTARHNAGSVVMYENETWRIGFETYYTGKQLLSNGTETTDYVLMGLLGMRNFSWGTIFVNFENFTDRRQSRFSPLVLPPVNDPTFTEIYAPADGFILSAGIIIKPFGQKEHH
ncbi:iron complex outermembrane recepter protein [Aquimarina amphilecti]|uniref:Iron complex outermembrane recepter protein n=1 Tax=Aquimarina amphilecti TaxID=1038014 RepID=A0A1H7HLX5_AQUAM|nr:TonB-dependent receptor [Aquimarina amphilecti]SEK51386.1 iron complex outermembrane recepter protein [Aquimarina amphilecti]